jgi:hypothetical protein
LTHSQKNDRARRSNHTDSPQKSRIMHNINLTHGAKLGWKTD